MNAAICLKGCKNEKTSMPIFSIADMILKSPQERAAIYSCYDDYYVESDEEREINKAMTKRRGRA